MAAKRRVLRTAVALAMTNTAPSSRSAAYAAAIRPPGWPSCDGSAAASSMVTPRKPAPNSSLRTTSRVWRVEACGDQHCMRIGGDEMLGDVVERAGVEHDVVVDAHQRIDGHGQPRRMQHRGIRPARSAADDLHARHPVLADDLPERCGADGKIAQARLGRIGHHRLQRRRRHRHIDQRHARLAGKQPRQRQRGERGACRLRHAHHRDLARLSCAQLAGDAFEVADRRRKLGMRIANGRHRRCGRRPARAGAARSSSAARR